MRSLTFVIALLGAVPVLTHAEEQKKEEKETRATTMLGFGYRDGAVRPSLALDNSPNDLAAGTLILFGEVRDAQGYIYGETTYPVQAPFLETHAFSAHGDLFSIFGFRADMGLDYRYLAEQAPVFTFEDTQIDALRRQHMALFSLGWGFGAYDGPIYLRHNGVFGGAYIENTLDVYVDGEPSHRNRNDLASGWAKVFGYRGEVGARIGRLQLSGGGMTLKVMEAKDGLLAGSQNTFFGTARFSTPWHIGVYVHGSAAGEKPNLLFLGNSVTFGITLNYP